MESLGGETEVLAQTRDLAVSERDTISGQGVKKVQELIQKVSAKFGDYFAELGYNGEVTLSRSDETDFKSYGVAIKVGVLTILPPPSSILDSKGSVPCG